MQRAWPQLSSFSRDQGYGLTSRSKNWLSSPYFALGAATRLLARTGTQHQATVGLHKLEKQPSLLQQDASWDRVAAILLEGLAKGCNAKTKAANACH